MVVDEMESEEENEKRFIDEESEQGILCLSYYTL